MAILMALDELEFKVAAIKAVIVVPMFAPKMKGAAFLRETTRLATNGTTADVVMVEDRIAAVVVTPKKNAFNRFLKNRSLNRSGEPVSNSPEINFLNRRIDVNSNAKESIARIKPLFITTTNQSIIILKPDHVNEKVDGDEFIEGTKK